MGIEFLEWAETVRQVRVNNEADAQFIADAIERAKAVTVESTDIMGLEWLDWAENVRSVRVDHEKDMQAIADAAEAAAEAAKIAAEELALEAERLQPLHTSGRTIEWSAAGTGLSRIRM